MLDKTGGSETTLISCGRSNRNKDAAWMQLPEQMNEELQSGIVDAQLLRLLGSDDHGSPEVSGTAHHLFLKRYVMRAAKRIEKLLQDLQLSPTGGLIGAPSEEECSQRLQLYSPRTFPNAFRISPRTSRFLALPSTTKDSPRQITRTNGSRLLREELGNVSKHLAEQRALVATLEVEITTVLQEKNIHESDLKAHIKELEGEVALFQHQLGSDGYGERDAAACEDLLRLLQELFSHDITVAQPLYTELLAVPEEKRRARDQILMLIYEKMLKFHEEFEDFSTQRETSTSTLTQANEEVQRLLTQVQQASITAASEKQEMLQEVERLTSEWRQLSVAAASEKEELVKEIQKLTDELRQVATTASIEKQDMRDEVQLLTHELRHLQESAHKERKNMKMELHRLTDELRQASTVSAVEKQDLNEEVQILTNELRLISESAGCEKQILNKEVQRLLNELRQSSTAAATEKQDLSQEVNKLKIELHELSTSAAAEKQEMTDELQRLTTKIKRLFAASASEKQAMQLKLDVITARNAKLAKEAGNALVQLEVLADKCVLNGQLKDKLSRLEKSSTAGEDEKELMSITLHEMMIEKQKLIDIIEDKDHSLELLCKVKQLDMEREYQQGKLRELRRCRQEQNMVHDLIDIHDFQSSPDERQLLVHTNSGLELIQRPPLEERGNNLGRSLTGQTFSCGLEMQDFGQFAAAITYASRIAERSPFSNKDKSKADLANKKNSICKALLSFLSSCQVE